MEFPHARVRDLFPLDGGFWISKKNALFDVTLHLPYVGWMCFRDVYDIERDLVLVSGVQLVERGNLPAKWRSSITSKDQNDRLRAPKRRKRHMTGMIEKREGEIWSGISDIDVALAGIFPHTLEGEQQEWDWPDVHHHARKSFRGQAHGISKSGHRGEIQHDDPGGDLEQTPFQLGVSLGVKRVRDR